MSDEPKELLKWGVWAWPGTDLVRLENDKGGDVTVRLSEVEFCAVVPVRGLGVFAVAAHGGSFEIEDAPGFPMLRELRNRWADFLAERGTAFLPRNLPVEQVEAAQ